MPQLVIGIIVMLAAMGVLLAMVVRAIEPGLTLSLLAYAGAFSGMAMVVAGAMRRLSRRQR